MAGGNFGEACGVGSEERTAARHGFEGGETKSFPEGTEDGEFRRGVKVGELLVRDMPNLDDVGGQVESANSLIELGAAPGFHPRKNKFRSIRVRTTQDGIGIQERDWVFARFDASDRDDKRVSQIELLAHSLASDVGINRREVAAGLDGGDPMLFDMLLRRQVIADVV